jgi:hypothetical protein
VQDGANVGIFSSRDGTLSVLAMTEGGGVRDEYMPGYRALARFGHNFLSTCKAISRGIQGLFIQLWWRRRSGTTNGGRFSLKMEHDRDSLWTPTRTGIWQYAPINFV